ncbi:MAG: methyltransferase domain-containing protein [Cyanobacteria bacterium SZAS-4]|nr:methyltransferase domain-containing protein [Cyanobacteria bacterium SZAS-4]
MAVETLQTLEFLAPYTASSAVRLLEVGCGRGELAMLLSPRVKMTAIDRSESAILAAMQIGVEAHLVDFFDFPEEQFDVVLFTRSLHHISPLGEAVAKAARMVAPGGRLIIEDFAAEKADQATVEWYFRTRDELISSGLSSPQSCMHHQIDESTEPLNWWRQHHFGKHHVATSEEMRAVIGEHFEIEKESFVPYMYRYLVAGLLSGVDASEIEWAVYGNEAELCELGEICRIGYRLVATKKA